MKKYKYYLLSIVCGFVLFTSCNGGGGEEEVVKKFLVDFEKISPDQPLLSSNIVNSINLLAYQYPGMNIGQLTEKTTYDVEIHKINYKTAFEGDTIIASGIIATPVQKETTEKFPIMSYQHGTLFEKTAAPSLNISTEVMTYIASTGMVIVIPDFIGFGASQANFHPYLHKEYTNNAVLDMIRAAKEFVEIEKPCNVTNDLFLFGYSQGGSATVGALKAIETDTKNSDISVTAAVAGAGAYNLSQFREWILKQQRYEKPSFILYMAESLKRYSGVTNQLSEIFSTDNISQLDGIVDGVNSGDDIDKMFNSYHIGLLFTNEFISEDFNTSDQFAALRTAFDQNSISGWNTAIPLQIYHGSADNWVPSEQSLRLYQEFTETGTTKTQLIPLPEMDHINAFFPSLIGALNYFESKKSSN